MLNDLSHSSSRGPVRRFEHSDEISFSCCHTTLRNSIVVCFTPVTRNNQVNLRFSKAHGDGNHLPETAIVARASRTGATRLSSYGHSRNGSYSHSRVSKSVHPEVRPLKARRSCVIRATQIVPSRAIGGSVGGVRTTEWDSQGSDGDAEPKDEEGREAAGQLRD